MSELIPAGVVVRVADLALSHEPVDAAQAIDGAPTVGSVALATIGRGPAGGGTGGLASGELRGVEVGVWECTPGVSTDTEADEVFVVISGRARIDFVSPALPSIEVGPGDMVRLEAGMQTVWTVTEMLRKVYVA